MLVLMVRGLFYKLNYPYAQFTCNTITGDLMFDPVWEAVSRLERLGFCVLALTYDGATPNHRLWKLHTAVPNVFATNGPRFLYFISDPPHLIETIHNSFCNSNRSLWVNNIYVNFCTCLHTIKCIFFTIIITKQLYFYCLSSFQCNGNYISWQHIVNLYHKETTGNDGVREVPKLKYEHIYLTMFSKM